MKDVYNNRNETRQKDILSDSRLGRRAAPAQFS